MSYSNADAQAEACDHCGHPLTDEKAHEVDGPGSFSAYVHAECIEEYERANAERRVARYREAVEDEIPIDAGPTYARQPTPRDRT